MGERKPRAERDGDAAAGTGVPCHEAQADGVPCVELQPDCADCDRREETQREPSTKGSDS